MNDDAANRQKSPMAGLFTFLGILLVAIGLAYGAYKLNSFQAQLQDMEKEIAARTVDIDSLGWKIENLDRAPIENLIELNAFAVPLTDDNGQQVYDFTVWIGLPRQRLNEIKEVKYKFERLNCYAASPSNICVSNDPASGFAISCRGAECESGVELELALTEGRILKLSMDMCEALGESGSN